MRAYRKSPTELNDLAVQVVRGEVYIAFGGDGLQHSFGALLALAGGMQPRDERGRFGRKPKKSDFETIGAVYEELRKALPRGINGHPMFMSCRFLHVNDVRPLMDLVERKQEALVA
jgi:hypothetical protein